VRQRRVLHLDLRHARKAVAEDLPVGGDISPEPMQPHRLIEVSIRFGSLGAGETRVPDAGSILRPGRVAAGRGVLHVRDDLANLSPRLDLEDVQIAVLAAAL
jgi:hypothetical protein